MSDLVAIIIGQLAVVALVTGVLVLFARSTLINRFFGTIPIAHKIAVIGLPGAGKTSLIAAMFELIQRGQAKPGTRLHGAKTIARVNRYVAQLGSGLPIGPTKEGDTFVFRFSYVRKRVLDWLSYDVEIADFPGEFSNSIQSAPEQIGVELDDEVIAETLLNREFFSWIASAREYLFLIDVSTIYSRDNTRLAIQDLSARIRTSWQVIDDAASDRGVGSVSRRRVHLVFSKVDTLMIPTETGSQFALRHVKADSSAPDQLGELQSIRKDGQRSDLFPDFNLAAGVEFELRALLEHDFSDLLQFFDTRVKRLSLVYTSLRVSTGKGQRLGVGKLLAQILP